MRDTAAEAEAKSAEAPAVTTDAPETKADQAEKPAHVLSLKELEKVLGGEVAEILLDELIEAEFARPEGDPRKGALRMLLKAERARGSEGTARPAIMTELSRALNAK